MKIIRTLEEMIEDEIHDIKKYAKMADAVRNEHPALAQVLFSISTQEDSHQKALHAEVVKIVEEYRRKNGDPPAAMLAVYEYMHERHVEKLEEAHRYQEMYRNG